MRGPGGRKKAEVWEHVIKLDGNNIECKHCGLKFAGGATRIGAHLYQIPNRGIRGCPKFGQPISGSNERDKSVARSCDLEGALVTASSTSCRNKVSETAEGTAPQLQAVDAKRMQTSYQVGPFLVSHNNYDELDLQLVQYVFDPSQDTSEEVVRFPHYLLKRFEFSTLKPEALLSATIIDIFAENFTKVEEEKMKYAPTRNWYLPVLFSHFALDGNVGSFIEFVQQQNIKKDFMPSDLGNCDKMFIPTHIGADSSGHFYLYVIDLKKKVVEILDSLPSYTTQEEHLEKAQKMLFVLDTLFNDKSKSWAFANFSVKMVENTAKQFNGYDCGIFVIKFMRESADAINNELFESDKERLDLALELLKSDLNNERGTLIDKAVAWHCKPNKEYQQMADANFSRSKQLLSKGFDSDDCNDHIHGAHPKVVQDHSLSVFANPSKRFNSIHSSTNLVSAIKSSKEVDGLVTLANGVGASLQACQLRYAGDNRRGLHGVQQELHQGFAASSSGTSSGSSMLQTSSSEEDLQVLVDQRKRMRIMSTRESARRSRMRKQKQLDNLTAQVAQLWKENEQILTCINITTQQDVNIEAENSVLRAQVDELSRRLDSLNEIIELLNGSNGVFGAAVASSTFIEPMNQPITGFADMFLH